MNRIGAATRIVVAAAILAFVVARVGGRPFRHGLQSVSVWPVVIAVSISCLTTACVADRWSQVVRAAGARLPFPVAFGAYYRSQFLNVVLPFGVLGDAHRAVVQGRRMTGLGDGVRTVVWDRVCGQVVQLVVTAGILLVLPSPIHSWMPWIAGVLLLLAVAVTAAASASRRSRRSAPRVIEVIAGDLRRLGAARVWPRITAMSLVALAGHTAVFLVAIHAAGITLAVDDQIGLALLVLAAMAIPLSIGGWGPREGIAYWAFAAAGPGGSAGVAASTTYAVLVMCAVAPGGALLLWDGARRRRRHRSAGVLHG